MSSTRFRAGTKWLTCILVAFSLTLFVGQNLLAEEYGLGDIPLPKEVYQKHLKVRADKFVLLDAAPPASYDARDYGIVTSAKDQGYCGSCWAFASVGAMESHLLKTFGFGPSDLSEQQQVSCNVVNYGCCGGYSSAARYWETNGPIYESCFSYGDSGYGTTCPPYSGVDCSDAGGCEELVYRVVGWHTVDATPTGFKTSLYEDGPSYWRFTVYSDFHDFWNYGNWGDVYYQTTGIYRGGHAVLLIGWDDSKGAYLCKNSWGTYGGPNGDGTFWIAYSGHNNNLGFGMSNFSVTGGAECGDGTCDPCQVLLAAMVLIMIAMVMPTAMTPIVPTILSASAAMECAILEKTVTAALMTASVEEAMGAVATASVSLVLERTVAHVPMIVREGRPANPRSASAVATMYDVRILGAPVMVMPAAPHLSPFAVGMATARDLRIATIAR